MNKVRWGVLGAAKIAVGKVIPAMQKGRNCEVVALASRSIHKARETADELGLAKAFGSYDELLADPTVDAVYIPLPNHLHVPWSIRALEAGKHVLCEKPIGVSGADAKSLADAARSRPELKLMEAFMYRFHPQWVTARSLVRDDRIGELRAIQTFFSFFNRDPDDIRNRAEWGGGGLLDIGCYPISLSRFLFGREPFRVFGSIDSDPQLNVDRLSTGVLDFGNGVSTFTCSTQLSPFQRVNIFGSYGRFEIEIPFNAPTDRPCRIWLHSTGGAEEIMFSICDQYTIQGEQFSQSILDDTPVPTPIDDALDNMAAIEAVFRSASSGRWEAPLRPR
jgi:predicted dehydrogenase